MRCATLSSSARRGSLGLLQQPRGSPELLATSAARASPSSSRSRSRFGLVLPLSCRSVRGGANRRRTEVRASTGGVETSRPDPSSRSSHRRSRRRSGKETQEGQAAVPVSAVDAPSLQLRVSSLEDQVAELLAWRRGMQQPQATSPQGADGGTQPPEVARSQPGQLPQQQRATSDEQEQKPQEQEPAAQAAAAAEEVEAEVEPELVGPYPDVHLPRTRPVPGEVVTADNVHVGLVVRRGPDWDQIHPNWIAAGRDGGPGSDGVVISVSKSGMSVFVRWRVSGEEMCCCITGSRGLRELVVAGAGVQTTKQQQQQEEEEQAAGAPLQRRWLWWPW